MSDVEDFVVQDAKEFSVAFACSVTRETGRDEDCIAKKGDQSLFALMKQVLPQVRTC